MRLLPVAPHRAKAMRLRTNPAWASAQASDMATDMEPWSGKFSWSAGTAEICRNATVTTPAWSCTPANRTAATPGTIDPSERGADAVGSVPG